jgi:uncharacterized membrane protein YccC
LEVAKMIDLVAENETRLHPDVASFLADAHRDVMQTIEKHKAKHLELRAEVEKRALKGDAEALQEYRHMVRLETIWKTLSARLNRDLQSLTDAVSDVRTRAKKEEAFGSRK